MDFSGGRGAMMKLKHVTDRFSSGVRLLLVCHLYYIAICIVYFIVLYFLDKFGIYVVVDGGVPGILFFIMLTMPGVFGQLVYVVPTAIYFSRKNKDQAVRGILTGALITGSLNIGVVFLAIVIGISSAPDTTPVNPFLKYKNSIPKEIPKEILKNLISEVFSSQYFATDVVRNHEICQHNKQL